MTELDFYKFIEDNAIEYHWNDDKVWFFVNTYQIDDFYELLKGSSVFDDDGIDCNMKDGYFAFEAVDICEYFGIEPEKIFNKT